MNGGNCYGVERQQWLLDAAIEVELPRYGLGEKGVHLLNQDDFEFAVFGVEFDYILAQSVVTHLAWNSIQRCLVNVEEVLRKEGRFYATFFEDTNGSHRTTPVYHTRGGTVTYPDRDPFHYEFDVLVELAKRTSLEVVCIGQWNHPRSQAVMVFTKPRCGV